MPITDNDDEKRTSLKKSCSHSLCLFVWKSYHLIILVITIRHSILWETIPLDHRWFHFSFSIPITQHVCVSGWLVTKKISGRVTIAFFSPKLDYFYCFLFSYIILFTLHTIASYWCRQYKKTIMQILKLLFWLHVTLFVAFNCMLLSSGGRKCH